MGKPVDSSGARGSSEVFYTTPASAGRLIGKFREPNSVALALVVKGTNSEVQQMQELADCFTQRDAWSDRTVVVIEETRNSSSEGVVIPTQAVVWQLTGARGAAILPQMPQE